MSDKITSDDLFGADLLGKGSEGLVAYAQHLREVNQGLLDMIKSGRDAVNVLKFESAGSIDKLNKSVAQLNTLISQSTNLTKQQATAESAISKAKIDQEKLAQQAIKVQNEKLKSTSLQYSLDQKMAKDKEREDKRAIASQAKIAKEANNYVGQLRAMTKELTAMGVAGKAGTSEFNALAEKAGDLRNKIKDAKEATAAFASSSKLTTAKTLFGQIASDLKNLDFEQAADKARTFASVVSQIKLKEVVDGLKNFGSALLNVGKALIANPFVMFATVIAGVGVLFGNMIKDMIDYGKQSQVVTDSLVKNATTIEDLLNKQFELQVKLNVLRGKTTKAEGDALLKDKENNDERLKLAKDYAAEVVKLAKDNGLNLSELKGDRFQVKLFEDMNKAQQNAFTGYTKTELAKIKFNRDIQLLTKSYNKLVLETAKKQSLDLAVVNAGGSVNAGGKKSVSSNGGAKLSLNDTAYQIMQERLKLLLIETSNKKMQLDIQREIDLNANSQENSDLEVKSVKALQIEAQYRKDLEALEEVHTGKMVKIKMAKGKLDDSDYKIHQDELAKAKTRQKEIQDAIFKEVEDGLKRQNELKSTMLDLDMQQRERNITQQQSLAERGFKNQLAFEQAQLSKDELAKEQLKKKEIRQQKALAYLKLIADDGFARGSIEFAIAQAISGSFKDGVEGIDGAGTETSDSILARLSVNESVITAKGTKENPGLATAMNSGTVDSYVKEKLLPSYISESSVNTESMAQNMATSAMLNQLVSVNERLKSVEKAIINKKESYVNMDNAGNVITTDIENGFKKVITKVRSKPRLG